MELFEAITFLIEAKPHITFLTQCICYVCLTNLTTTSLINFDRPVGIHIFLHIHTRTFLQFSWRSWSRLLLFCRRPSSLWSCVHFNQCCCHLCLKISSYENWLLWNLKKGRVTPIQQPGVDHSHGYEIPEKESCTISETSCDTYIWQGSSPGGLYPPWSYCTLSRWGESGPGHDFSLFYPIGTLDLLVLGQRK